MTFNYTPLNTTAKTLLTKFGQTVTFSRLTETYNITSRSVSTSTYTANVVIIDEAKEESTPSSVIGVIHNAVAHSTTPILVGDTTTINSQNYRVLSVKEVKPATTVIYYELQLGA